MALSTLSKLKTHLGLSGTAEDTLLTQLLGEVDAAVKNYLGWNPEQANYTEIYDAPLSPELPLLQTPVTTTGLRVWLDEGAYFGQAPTAFAAPTELTLGAHFYLKLDGPGSAYSLSGLLVRVSGPWSRRFGRSSGRLGIFPTPGQGSVKVTYQGGYATVPLDLELAVHQVCARVRLGRRYGMPMDSESYEGYSYHLADLIKTALLAGDLQTILARYRRLVL